MEKLGFTEGFLGIQAVEAKAKAKPSMVFNWDKAAAIIRNKYFIFKDLAAEAGLEGDWCYTSGVIFENGNAKSEEYIYLQSNWATPILILHCGGEMIEIECWVEENERFKSDTTWDEISLNILKNTLS